MKTLTLAAPAINQLPCLNSTVYKKCQEPQGDCVELSTAAVH